jgi:hypothetical protein
MVEAILTLSERTCQLQWIDAQGNPTPDAKSCDRPCALQST